MGGIDLGIIVLYFVLIFVVAFMVTRKERKEQSSTNYFLGGKNSGWFVIGASLFASNIGSEHLIGLAGSGARGDFVNGQFEILAALILLLLGWLFVPFYLKTGVYTMPEFLEKRYSRSARNYLSIISIFAYVLTKISVTIFAGALVFEQLIGIDFWVGAIIVVVATGIYTLFGGLKAVVYTDLVQMFILIGGAIGVTAFGIYELGGIDQVMASIRAEVSVDKANNYLSLWRPNSDADYPWTGILFGAPILGIWYWCTDQFIVQRVLSAKDQSNARKGTIFAGFLKLLPLFLFVFPGVIAFALHTQDGMLLMGENGQVNFDAALPAMVSTYLPTGMKGIVAAGLLAALMSSLSSVFNSSSTLVTMDLYKVVRPESTERRLVYVGQITTAVLVVLGLLWIPLMEDMMEDGGLFKYLQSIQAYIAPPIAVVFLFGILSARMNKNGALSALWFGFVVGTTRLALEFLSAKDEMGKAILSIDPGSGLAWFVEMNFLHFALFLFVICAFVHVAVSAMFKTDVNKELVLSSMKSTEAKHEKRTDLVLSLALIACVLLMWGIFSQFGIA